MKCKQCGTEVNGNTKFCTKCGAPLPEDRVERKEKKKGNMVLKIALVVLGIVVFVALVGLLAQPFKMQRPEGVEISEGLEVIE